MMQYMMGKMQLLVLKTNTLEPDRFPSFQSGEFHYNVSRMKFI